MSMKKALIMMLILSMAFFAFVGCDEGGEPADTENGEDTNGEDVAEEDLEIDIIVGFGAGGSNDLSARYMAQAMRDHGVVANIINMPGSSGTEAVYHVSQQSPDSMTFMWAHSPMMIFEPAMGDRGYEFDDFVPVGTLASATFGVATRSDMPWGNDFEALVEYIEENPGEVSFGGQGLGNLAHFLHNKALPLEELDYTYAPLGGGADVLLGLEGGHVDIGAVSMAAVSPMLESGTAEMLYHQQILTETIPGHEDVPSITEFGIEASSPHPMALWAPVGTDEAVIQRITEAMEAASKNPLLSELYEPNGMLVHYLNPEETAELFEGFREDLLPEFLDWAEQYQ